MLGHAEITEVICAESQKHLTLVLNNNLEKLDLV